LERKKRVRKKYIKNSFRGFLKKKNPNKNSDTKNKNMNREIQCSIKHHAVIFYLFFISKK